MPSGSSKQWPAKLLSLLLFLVVVTAIEVFHAKQLTFLKNESYSEAKKQLSIIRSRIEAAIVSDMYILNNFSTLVTINPRKRYEKLGQDSRKHYSRWISHSTYRTRQRRHSKLCLPDGR